MVGVRDVVWGISLGVVGVLLFQSYPLLRAEQFVQKDAKLAFLEAFQGRRMIDGTLVQLPAGGAVPVDPMAQPIDFVNLNIVAEHTTWNGGETQLVLHHVLSFDRMRPDTNRVLDVYVKLMMDGAHFRYEHFQVRGQPPLPLPIGGNPWLPLLRSEAGNGLPPTHPKRIVEPME